MDEQEDVLHETKPLQTTTNSSNDAAMVAKGALGKYTPGKPGPTQYWLLLLALSAFSVGGGYFAGIQPTGEWRYFSWHPLLMTVGMVGFAGIGAVTKKLGGYTNTKSHAVLAWGSIFLSLAGLYCIYNNKEMNGWPHLQSAHAMFGVGVMVSCIGLGLVGSIVLHPDFGIDTGNKTIRFWHKFGARIVLILAWITAFLGLTQLIPHDQVSLLLFAVPMLAFVPFVLM